MGHRLGQRVGHGLHPGLTQEPMVIGSCLTQVLSTPSQAPHPLTLVTACNSEFLDRSSSIGVSQVIRDLLLIYIPLWIQKDLNFIVKSKFKYEMKKYISNQWVDLLTAPFPYRKNAGLATKPEKKDVEGVVLFHTLVKFQCWSLRRLNACKKKKAKNSL